MIQWHIETIHVPVNNLKIYFVGDLHEGQEQSLGYSFEQLMNQISKEKNSRIILMGDMLEMAVKTKMTTDQVLAQKLQVEVFLHRMRKVLKKVICVLSGNHEDRVLQAVGIDYVKDALMPHFPNAVYLGYEGFLRVTQRGGETLMYLHHGTGGSMRPDFFLEKLLFKLGIGGLVDVVASAHIHQKFHKIYKFPVIDKNHIKTKDVHGIRTGCFLGRANYAKIAGFGITDSGGMVLEINSIPTFETITRRVYET